MMVGIEKVVMNLWHYSTGMDLANMLLHQRPDWWLFVRFYDVALKEGCPHQPGKIYHKTLVLGVSNFAEAIQSFAHHLLYQKPISPATTSWIYHDISTIKPNSWSSCSNFAFRNLIFPRWNGAGRFSIQLPRRGSTRLDPLETTPKVWQVRRRRNQVPF
jgi:hypothetical protein